MTTMHHRQTRAQYIAQRRAQADETNPKPPAVGRSPYAWLGPLVGSIGAVLFFLHLAGKAGLL